MADADEDLSSARLAAAEAALDTLRQRLVRLNDAEFSLRAAKLSLRAVQDEKEALAHRYRETQREVAEIRNSLSWRLTSPLRGASTLLRRALLGIAAWMLLKPGSRPRRTLDAVTDRLRGRLQPRGEQDSGTDVRYFFVDHTIGRQTNTGPQWVVRGLAKAMLDAGQDVRFVKWNAAAGACVLIDGAERNRLAEWNGPALTERDAALYRRKGAKGAPVKPRAGSWLIVPEVTYTAFQTTPVTEDLAAWARKAGLKVGFVFYDTIPLKRPKFEAIAPAHAAYMRALRLADAIWPVSRQSADELAAFWDCGRDGDNRHLPRVHPIPLPPEFDQASAALAAEGLSRPMTDWTAYVAALAASLSAPPPLVYYWVDTTIAFPANTGIQRVARQLARGLIEAGVDLVPVQWGGIQQPFKSVSLDGLEHFARWNGPAPDRWHDWVAPEAHSGGGWFLMAELPLNLTDAEQKIVRTTAETAGLKSAAVFYDTIPWKMRDIYPEPFAQAHLAYIGELANYTIVLPISHYSRSEMASVLEVEFRLPESSLSHIIATPLAGEFPGAAASVAAPHPDRPIHILCVGTVEPRKNHERLLDAFELACKTSARPLRLTIVGSGHSFDDSVAARVRRRIVVDPRIEWVDDADDSQIKHFYEDCDFTVYPSVEEGFGMPILESLWHGKPVVCADFGAMNEVAAEGGGCFTVDVRSPSALAGAMLELANCPSRLEGLAIEARARTFKSWKDYAAEVADKLDLWMFPEADHIARLREAMGLGARPRLSVCISAYNRAEWLGRSLNNITQLHPSPVEGVEFLVCDNASTDSTPDVARPTLLRPDFRYRRNRVNVGMLGNLREAARAARGDYVWILGDGDILRSGAVERVLEAIEAAPEAALVYLNYAQTTGDARAGPDFHFNDARPVVSSEPDLIGPVHDICALNENVFTAIYTLVFRRDHALAAYSQDTSGRPFSSMLTCIPTTRHVLKNMMEEIGVWIGEPQLVNLNVSWIHYAPLWILERIPEASEEARDANG